MEKMTDTWQEQELHVSRVDEVAERGRYSLRIFRNQGSGGHRHFWRPLSVIRVCKVRLGKIDMRFVEDRREKTGKAFIAYFSAMVVLAATI